MFHNFCLLPFANPHSQFVPQSLMSRLLLLGATGMVERVIEPIICLLLFVSVSADAKATPVAIKWHGKIQLHPSTDGIASFLLFGEYTTKYSSVSLINSSALLLPHTPFRVMADCRSGSSPHRHIFWEEQR